MAHRRCALLAALLLLSSPLSALAAALPLPAREVIPAAHPVLEAALLSATNAARARQGLASLTADEGLARAAREHAAEMARLEYFSHGSPIPAHDTLPKRLALAGSPLTDVAENIVMFGSPGGAAAAAEQAVRDWLGSPPHRKNLLDRSYDVVGFGTAEDAHDELFVVQDFGSQPAQLQALSLVRAWRTVSEVRVAVRARLASKVLFRLGDDPPQTRSLPAGPSTVVLDSAAQGSVRLLAGVPHGGGYVVDDGGTVDLILGTFRHDRDEPRQELSIQGVTVQRRAERGSRLTLRYGVPPGRTLALFLQGSFQPNARAAAGVFTLFLPDALGTATVSVGVDGGGSTVDIVHRFHVDPGAPTPTLLAGPAP